MRFFALGFCTAMLAMGAGALGLATWAEMGRPR